MISADEEGMDLLSVSDNFDITREEESTLLEEDSMAVDSPIKTTKERKQIVFDLEDSDDDNENEEMRQKFKSERKTISFTLNETKKREIPDTLDGVGNRQIADNFKKMRERDPKIRRQKKRNQNRYHHFGQRQQERQFGRQGVNPNMDLRQLINSVKQNQFSGHPQSNPFLINQGLTPLMNYQLDLGILNPAVAQNQLLVNALLAQAAANPLLNRLSIGGQNLSVVRPQQMSANKRKDDIRITVINDNKVVDNSINATKTQTKSKIRCRVTDLDTTDSTDGELIEKGVPSMPATAPTTQKKQMSTLFAKHLSAKVNESKTKPQNSVASTSGTSGGGLFGDALAEVEVGVDNDYLRRMQEMEQKRLELQKHKEQRRLEMADERLESALKLKQKIGNQRNY